MPVQGYTSVTTGSMGRFVKHPEAGAEQHQFSLHMWEGAKQRSAKLLILYCLLSRNLAFIESKYRK